MELVFKSKALQDIEYWKRSGQKQIQQKISILLNDILAHPFSGLGKPESLKYDLTGFGVGAYRLRIGLFIV